MTGQRALPDADVDAEALKIAKIGPKDFTNSLLFYLLLLP